MRQDERHPAASKVVEQAVAHSQNVFRQLKMHMAWSK